jgi:alpha-D-ribose 1-methylphosphonate 5-triphosphate synthase subunit PhnG
VLQQQQQQRRRQQQQHGAQAAVSAFTLLRVEGWG